MNDRRRYLAELLGTALLVVAGAGTAVLALVFTVLTVTQADNTSAVAGIPIGIALIVCHLVAVPIDGTSVNPARSFGPALIAGGDALSQLWLFLVAPLVGAVLAAVIHRFLSPTPALPRPASHHHDSSAMPATSPRPHPAPAQETS